MGLPGVGASQGAHPLPRPELPPRRPLPCAPRRAGSQVFPPAPAFLVASLWYLLLRALAPEGIAYGLFGGGIIGCGCGPSRLPLWLPGRRRRLCTCSLMPAYGTQAGLASACARARC